MEQKEMSLGYITKEESYLSFFATETWVWIDENSMECFEHVTITQILKRCWHYSKLFPQYMKDK